MIDQVSQTPEPPILKDFPDSFETRRLFIRPPLPGNGPELHAAVTESIEELRPWMPWVENHRTTQDSEESVRRARVRFLERSDLMLLLFLKETGTLVGSSGLHRVDWTVPKFEISYWCRSRFTGKGYITEAVRSISAFAFETLDARRGDPVRLPKPPQRKGGGEEQLHARRQTPQRCMRPGR